VNELVYTAPFGVIGSYVGLGLNLTCLIAEFYDSVAPKDVMVFFENYLALPLVLVLYLVWKFYSYFTKNAGVKNKGWRIFLPMEEIDVVRDIRDGALDIDLPPRVKYPTFGEWLKAAPMRTVRSLF
jgi:amino acid transporter